MWFAKFKNGAQEFVAIGDDRDLMNVYRIADGGAVKTNISFPNCLKFMPYAEVSDSGQKTKKWIEETYGVF